MERYQDLGLYGRYIHERTLVQRVDGTSSHFVKRSQGNTIWCWDIKGDHPSEESDKKQIHRLKNRRVVTIWKFLLLQDFPRRLGKSSKEKLVGKERAVQAHWSSYVVRQILHKRRSDRTRISERRWEKTTDWRNGDFYWKDCLRSNQVKSGHSADHR